MTEYSTDYIITSGDGFAAVTEEVWNDFDGEKYKVITYKYN